MTNKTLEALALAEVALMDVFDYDNVQQALDAVREAKAELEKQEPFMCEPVPPVSEDGWTDWVCPTPRGYLMQCCDCGLIHEVDTRVAKYEPMPSEEFEVVDDPDMQCQWRMRRRDDLSNPVKQEPVAYFLEVNAGCSSKPLYEQVSDEYKNDADVFPLYAAPVRTKDLTDGAIWEILETHPADIITAIRAGIDADREKNK